MRREGARHRAFRGLVLPERFGRVRGPAPVPTRPIRESHEPITTDSNPRKGKTGNDPGKITERAHPDT
ncbi:hypothetical protein GCM10022205_49750 [Spinactinospora alkalitolerans]